MNLDSNGRDWAYADPSRAETEKRRQIIDEFGDYFSKFAKYFTSFNLSPEAKERIKSIAANANRYGDYRLSILEVLALPTDDPEVKADNTAYRLILEAFNKRTSGKYPEFRINQPGSAIHLQTLSAFIARLL